MSLYDNFWSSIKPVSIIAVGVILDQWTKYWAVSTLSFWSSYAIIPPILKFQLVYNYGAAYGILQNQRLFLLAVSGIVVVIAAFFYRLIVSTAWSKWGLVFIMIGTIGNSLDRLLLGYVVDFIDITIIPVFNIADISINIGVICFIIEMISISRKNKS